MGINLKLKTEVITKSRIQVLYEVVEKLYLGFGGESRHLDTIRKGIYDRRIIEKITLNYLDSDERIQARIIIEIDWNKHNVLAKNEAGKSFELDPGTSIDQQISKMYALLIEHTEKLRQKFNIKTIKVHYNFIREISNDTKKYEDAQRFLGTIKAEDLEWSLQSNIANIRSFEMEWEYISNRLSELKIKIEHNK